MKNQIKHFKNRIIGLILIFLIPLLVACPPIKIHIKEAFMVAFTDENSKIKVRYSSDGINWNDGKFPGQNITYPFNGVGAITDDIGLLNIIAIDGQNKVNLQWGLGPEIWDQSSQSETTEPITSAPNGVSYSNYRWLIAYNTNGKVIEAKVYDSQSKGFIMKLDLDDPLNTNVEGRPAIVFKNGKFILAWRIYQNQIPKLIYTTGQLNSEIPIFNRPFKELPLPSSQDYKAGPTSDPDLTFDSTNIYMAFVREQMGGGAGTLHGWDPLLYKSTDGINWEYYKTIPGLRVVGYNTFINIASKSKDTLLAASVRDTKIASASLLRNGNWTIFDENMIKKMFGANKISPKQFSLIKYGKN